MQYSKTLLTFSLLGLMTDILPATETEIAPLLKGIPAINNDQTSVFIQSSPEDRDQSVPSLNNWYEKNVIATPSRYAKGASLVTSALIGTLGSAVLIDLSYDFGATAMNCGPVGGAVAAFLASFSPVCGFYRINKVFTDQFFLETDDGTQDLCTTKLWGTRLLKVFGSSCMALPFAYATHTHSQEIKFVNINPSSALFLLDMPAYVSNCLVYALMTQNIIRDLSLYRHQTKTDEIATKANKKDGDIEAKRKFLSIHFKTLSAWYTNKKTDNETIKSIYQNAGLPDTSERSESITIPHVGSRETQPAILEPAHQAFNHIDQRLMSLINPGTFSENADHYKFKEECFSKKRALATLGGVLSVAGSYYLADMGQQQIQKIGTSASANPLSVDIASRTCEGILLFFASIYGFNTGHFTFASLYDLCSNLFNKDQANQQSSEGSTLNNIVIPLAIVVLAAARATPNVELSLNFLGEKKYDYFLTACTFVNVFALSVWSLNLFFNSFYKKTDIQQKRSTLVNSVNKLLDMTSTMTTQTVSTLFDVIFPQGVPSQEVNRV